MQWHFYHAQSGLLHEKSVFLAAGGRQDVIVEIEAATALANAPEGYVPISGVTDALSQRVDVATGALLDYQPAQPSPQHVWDQVSRRWRLSATTEATNQVRAHALTQIAALEASQGRALREQAIGTAGAVDRLRAIDAQIAALRSSL
jgi:hypothetical protein